MRRYAMPAGDEIVFEMRLPSGEPGLRGTGHSVEVLITRGLLVEVRSPSSGRLLRAGSWNLCSVVWGPGEELCSTALEMVDATVDAVTKLFVRGYFDASWLEARARYEIGAF
jgi:hypothetical protein